MRCWGRAEIGQSSFSISQQDSAEFVQFWLNQMKTPAFAMQWEKRLSMADATHVMDLSHEQYTPLCLKFDDSMIMSPSCTVNALVSKWHQADGMQTALLTAPDALCVHIDRCVMGSDLTVHKCLCKLQIDEECYFPVFAGDAISCDFIPT